MNVLPVSFFLLAFSLMNVQTSFFPLILQSSALVLFIASSFWDFKGLFFSCALSCSVFLLVSPDIFLNVSSLVFFLIMVNTSFIVALQKKMGVTDQQAKEEELTRLKAWESHYYVFRHQCLEELETVRNVQENFFFIEEELQILEKERMEEFLEEDTSQKALLELFILSQKKSLELQQEVELLEEILLQESKVQPKSKAVRKKKSKEEPWQGMLF